MTISELKSRFVKIEKLKKGGQKTVYKAILPDNTLVALKIIPNISDKRVLQEIDILKNLNSVNIPKILEAGIVSDEEIEEEALYIVEEYIDGSSLRDLINNKQLATLNAAYNLLSALITIETLLEEKGILHRDINPNNVMIDKSDNVYLIDFGIAKRIDGPSLTVTEAIHGPFTPGYAPHEQFSNMKLQQDVRTDLFQIGVTIYEYCTGENPFVKPTDTVNEILSKTVSLHPTPITFDGDSKGMFSQFVGMLMAKSQSQRPNSAKDALRYLNVIKPTLILEV